LLGNENELTYVALKNINLVIQKRPNILDKELKIFFCNFNDPIYIKLGKYSNSKTFFDKKKKKKQKN